MRKKGERKGIRAEKGTVYSDILPMRLSQVFVSKVLGSPSWLLVLILSKGVCVVH